MEDLRGTGRFTPPLSTRMRSYGSFQIVSGDFKDTFLLLTKWNGSVSLYCYEDDGDLYFINEFESLTHVMKEFPGFAIVDPSNAMWQPALARDLKSLYKK